MKCNFAHGVNEIREISRNRKYKTEKCNKFYRFGYCPYAERCQFMHGDKDYHGPQVSFENFIGTTAPRNTHQSDTFSNALENVAQKIEKAVVEAELKKIQTRISSLETQKLHLMMEENETEPFCYQAVLSPPYKLSPDTPKNASLVATRTTTLNELGTKLEFNDGLVIQANSKSPRSELIKLELEQKMQQANNNYGTNEEDKENQTETNSILFEDVQTSSTTKLETREFSLPELPRRVPDLDNLRVKQRKTAQRPRSTGDVIKKTLLVGTFSNAEEKNRPNSSQEAKWRMVQKKGHF